MTSALIEIFAHLGEPEHLLYFFVGVGIVGVAGGVVNMLYSRFMARSFPRVTATFRNKNSK